MKISLVLSDTPMVRALGLAEEAYWNDPVGLTGKAKGHDYAYWQSVAKRELAKAEAEGKSA